MPGAVRFNGTTDQLFNTASLPTGTFTITCWGNCRVDRNTFSGIWAIEGSGTTANEMMLESDVDGTTMKIWANSAFTATGQAMTVGTWYRFGLTKTGSTGTFYYGPAGAALSTSTAAPPSTMSGNTSMSIGGFRRNNEIFNGSVAAFKVWNGVAMTAAEIAAEFTQYQPVQRASLQRYYSFAGGSQTLDESGGGFTLTQSATAPTLDTAGPPIPMSVTPIILPQRRTARRAVLV